jgi:ABC-type nitrate/sulfonate/bicarbonate transport system ATPase subunit
MTTENSVGAASDTKVNRPTIDWRQVHRNVRRLQVRIVKATQNCGEAASQEGRWKGLSGLSRKIHEPFSGGGRQQCRLLTRSEALHLAESLC